MINPTIGRIVWYQEAGSDQPCAAIVTYVWNDYMVNLSVFDHNGVQRSETSVHLKQDNEDAAPFPYCEWMPYQKGQAAKTESLEKGEQCQK